jgi:hypothetical protein
MARKPVDQVRAQALRGQAHIWGVIMALGDQGNMTLNDIHGETNASRDTVREYVTRLVKGGYLESLPPDQSRQEAFYRLVRRSRDYPRLRKDGKECPPTKRESMWRTMRMIKRFDYRELGVSASTEDTPIKERDAADYCKHLLKAGYLKVITKATPKSPHRYQLIRDTGPKPPMIQRVKQVYDPNLKQVVWQSKGAGND